MRVPIARPRTSVRVGRNASEAGARTDWTDMKLLLGWAAVSATAVFVGFNLDKAKVWFFGMRAEMPIGFVVIASAVLGAFASYGFLGLRRKS